MRITVRLIISLVVVATAVVFLFAGLQARQEQARREEELGQRAVVLAQTFREAVEPLLTARSHEKIQQLVERFSDRERLAGLAVFDENGQLLAATASLPQTFRLLPGLGQEAISSGQEQGTFLKEKGSHRWHLQAAPLMRDLSAAGALVIFHDASFIETRSAELWRQNFQRLLLHVLLISLTTLLIVRWSFLRPMRKTAEWLKAVRTGQITEQSSLPKEELFAPLTREVTQVVRSLLAARAAAEEEARLRNAAESRWTAERLKEHVRTVLEGRPLVVVANREPYMHVHEGRNIRCIVPASGLVTAMEPILRACGGTWIGHGSGDADKETVDAHSRIRVPPEAPAYTLRRVWLQKAEEEGYYYGFSNEGLWPLCHIAHTRPLFRMEDWVQYHQVNGKFARAVLEELQGTENPCVLIQDYHFALLPRLIKEKRPDARIALFWHIPWPNPEAFGICPWARDLLQGMLGADLIGFHIQFHCNNFLDTVDRMLESRIDWENFSIHREGHTAWVKPLPISIAFEEPYADSKRVGPASGQKQELLKALGLQVQWLGVGVDRVDYTKGIGERFRAVERFFEKHPQFQGKFTFVELGAPSRTLIKRYHDLGAELEEEAQRINQRFQTRQWKPIVFLNKYHSHPEILPFYRAADVCLVTSLHDGMNLVAKEFVAAREDGRGVLILSRFAGASRELRDALLVNPYDIEQMAEAIHYALKMDSEEQKSRMSQMRQTLQEHNVYRWAADLVTHLASLRTAPQKTVASSPPPAG